MKFHFYTYILLAVFLLGDFVGAATFDYRSLSLKNGVAELDAVPLGEEVLLSVDLNWGQDFTVNKALTDCACLEVLQFPHEVKEGIAFTAYLLFKPLKIGNYKIEVEFLSNTSASQKFIFKSSAVENPVVPFSGQIKISRTLLQRSLKRITKNYYVSAEKAVKNFKSLTFIDIRPAELYRKSKIVNSLNFSPTQLKTLAVFKDKNIILVDQGNYNSKTESLCKALRTSGFSKTFILQGGLQTLASHQSLISGHPEHHLSPADFLASKAFDSSLYFTDSVSPELKGFALPVEKLTTLNLSGKQVFYLGDDTDQHQELLQATTYFTLKGGTKEFTDFLIKQTGIQNSSTLSTSSKTRKCGGCP